MCGGINGPGDPEIADLQLAAVQDNQVGQPAPAARRC